MIPNRLRLVRDPPKLGLAAPVWRQALGLHALPSDLAGPELAHIGLARRVVVNPSRGAPLLDTLSADRSDPRRLGYEQLTSGQRSHDARFERVRAWSSCSHPFTIRKSCLRVKGRALMQIDRMTNEKSLSRSRFMWSALPTDSKMRQTFARPASRARFLPQQARLGRSEDPARSASATTRCHP